MALLTKSVPGEISGKMGNAVVRKMNGKLFISQRPSKYKKHRGKIPARLKMRTVIPFCAALNRIGDLKKVWEKADINAGNAYQKMVKHALENSGPERLSTNNKITPGGVQLIPDRFDLINETVFIDISNDTKGLNSIIDNGLSAYLLFYLYEPLDKIKDSGKLFLVKKNLDGESVKDGLYFDYKVEKYYKKLLDNYGKCIVYFAVVSIDINNDNLKYSDTISKKFNLTG